MKKTVNARTATIQVLLRLQQQKGSLASELTLLETLEPQEKRFAHELCYGLCRWYYLIDAQLKSLVAKPLKNKDADIRLLMMLGIYQLQFTRVAPHAAINETVNAVMFFKKPWAKKLVNGVLRSYQRQQEELTSSNPLTDVDACQRSHPRWLQKAISRAWPEQADPIFTANNQHPPFTLRVNRRYHSVEQYRDLLNNTDIQSTPTSYSADGLTLSTPTDVTQLPGFAQGHISVQDEAAQLAAELLQLQPNQRVLDACCAPGGKTCHIAEAQSQLDTLVAIDLEERRLARVRENMARLSVDAQVICGDATEPDTWWDKKPFDRILLDAPCSATGVIRRHPDIKLLRTRDAIDQLAALQLKLLQSLWPLLADGGILLYATCSVLPQENVEVIKQFLSTQTDAMHDVLIASDQDNQQAKAPWGIEQEYGRQLLPQHNGHDGFYYARLVKNA